MNITVNLGKLPNLCVGLIVHCKIEANNNIRLMVVVKIKWDNTHKTLRIMPSS